MPMGNLDMAAMPSLSPLLTASLNFSQNAEIEGSVCGVCAIEYGAIIAATIKARTRRVLILMFSSEGSMKGRIKIDTLTLASINGHCKFPAVAANAVDQDVLTQQLGFAFHSFAQAFSDSDG